MAYRGLHNWSGATEDLKEAIKLMPNDREARDMLKKTKEAAAEARYCICRRQHFPSGCGSASYCSGRALLLWNSVCNSPCYQPVLEVSHPRQSCSAEEVAKRRRGEQEKLDEFLSEQGAQGGDVSNSEKTKPRMKRDEQGFLRMEEAAAPSIAESGADAEGPRAAPSSVGAAPPRGGSGSTGGAGSASAETPATTGDDPSSWRRVAVEVEDGSDDEDDEPGSGGQAKAAVSPVLPAFSAQGMSQSDFDKFVDVLSREKDERILFCSKVGTNRSKLDVVLSDAETLSVQWKRAVGDGVVPLDASRSGDGGGGGSRASAEEGGGAAADGDAKKSKNKKKKAAAASAEEEKQEKQSAAVAGLENALRRIVKVLNILCSKSDFHCELCSRAAKYLWPVVATRNLDFRYDVLSLLEEMSQRSESALAMAVFTETSAAKSGRIEGFAKGGNLGSARSSVCELGLFERCGFASEVCKSQLFHTGIHRAISGKASACIRDT